MDDFVAHFFSTATMASKSLSSGAAAGQLRCACELFAQQHMLVRQTTHLPPSSTLQFTAYDPHTLECSDTVSPSAATEQRRRHLLLAATRMREHASATHPRPCSLLAALAVFCDESRFQFDFLGESEHNATWWPAEGAFSSLSAGARRALTPARSTPSPANLSAEDSETTACTAKLYRSVAMQLTVDFAHVCPNVEVYDAFRF